MRRWCRSGTVVVAFSLAVLGAVGVPSGLAAPAGPTHSQSNPGGPVVAVSPSTVAPGQTLEVSGYNFPAGIGVTVQLCGNNALSGSPDCVLDNVGSGGTGSGNSFTIPLVVSIPPVPCPCVAMVSSQRMSSTPTSPVTIVGAPVAPIKPPVSAATVTQPLQVLNAQLSGNGPWYSWFGGMAQRTLNLTVHNPNKGVYPHPSLVLGAGKSGGALSIVATSSLPSMAPGATTTVHVKVVFPAFTFGGAQVVGTVGDAALMQHIKVTTTIVPWGLIVIALIILQLVFLAVRNALRRRNARREGPPEPDHATPPDGVPVVPTELAPTGEVERVGAG
jgi:hypothetical protein